MERLFSKHSLNVQNIPVLREKIPQTKPLIKLPTTEKKNDFIV